MVLHMAKDAYHIRSSISKGVSTGRCPLRSVSIAHNSLQGKGLSLIKEDLVSGKRRPPGVNTPLVVSPHTLQQTVDNNLNTRPLNGWYQ